MSKILNTIQELWSYCLYCPICKDTCREITVAAGPDDNFKLISFIKENHILTFQCVFKKTFIANYEINCLDNTFKIIGNNPNLDQTYCYFYIQSICRACNSTHVAGTDLELNLEEKSIYNIGIEREGIYLLSTKDMYHITMLYLDSRMLVSKCFKDEAGVIIDDNRVCTLPLVDIDFSKPRKATQRIKTMLVFS